MGRPIIKESYRQRAIAAGMRPHEFRASIEPEYAEHLKEIRKRSYLKHRAERLVYMDKYNEKVRLAKLN